MLKILWASVKKPQGRLILKGGHLQNYNKLSKNSFMESSNRLSHKSSWIMMNGQIFNNKFKMLLMNNTITPHKKFKLRKTLYLVKLIGVSLDFNLLKWSKRKSLLKFPLIQIIFHLIQPELQKSQNLVLYLFKQYLKKRHNKRLPPFQRLRSKNHHQSWSKKKILKV